MTTRTIQNNRLFKVEFMLLLSAFQFQDYHACLRRRDPALVGDRHPCDPHNSSVRIDHDRHAISFVSWDFPVHEHVLYLATSGRAKRPEAIARPAVSDRQRQRQRRGLDDRNLARPRRQQPADLPIRAARHDRGTRHRHGALRRAPAARTRTSLASPRADARREYRGRRRGARSRPPVRSRCPSPLSAAASSRTASRWRPATVTPGAAVSTARRTTPSSQGRWQAGQSLYFQLDTGAIR